MMSRSPVKRRRQTMCYSAGLWFAVISMGTTAVSGPPSYTITDLGAVPTFAQIFGGSVNAEGRVVGVATRYFTLPNGGGDEQVRSFLRMGNEQREVLLFNGNVHVWDINAHGQVAGTTGYYCRNRAFVWNDGAWTILEALHGSSSWCFSINDHGQVAGGSYVDDTNLSYHATLWQPNGSPVDLGTLGGSGGLSNATAVNNLSVVVGWTDYPGISALAFRWQNGQMIPLTGPGGPESHRPTIALD